jgi:hypothetical protein
MPQKLRLRIVAARLEPSFDDGFERRPALAAHKEPAPFPARPFLLQRSIAPRASRRANPLNPHLRLPRFTGRVEAGSARAFFG